MTSFKENLVSISFRIVVIVFCIRFAYLGIQLTKIMELAQITTLQETSTLFVVSLMRTAVGSYDSWFNLVVNVSKHISLSNVILAGIACILPHKKERLKNFVFTLALIGIQCVFVLAMLYIVQSSVTFAQGITRAHALGWSTVVGSGLILSVCVYSLINMMYDMYQESVRGDSND